MDDGAFARVFLFMLENGMQVVARIILPVRESVKTEAEVAAMELVRGHYRQLLLCYCDARPCSIVPNIVARTSIPVPKVYLYCGTPKNPVKAEWILMEYMPGLCLADGFEQLTYEQKRHTATDVAKIMFSLFNITSAECGSISPYSGDRSDESLCHNSLRYPLFTPLFSPRLTPTLKGQSGIVGPINDLTFLDYPRQVDPQLCGPFNSERSFMEAFAFLGTPPTRTGGKVSCWVFEKTLEVYDVVKKIYSKTQQSEVSSSNHNRFHFAHGDLSDFNILIDPATGAVTGVIDWEMAGFRPAWLAAVGGRWFDDDSERSILMSDFQDSRGNHAEETPADAVLRAHFRLRLATLDAQLFRHHLQGIELRALLYACCNEFDGNTEMWLEKYRDQEWVVGRRGDFPFDLREWIHERLDLEDRCVFSTAFSSFLTSKGN